MEKTGARAPIRQAIVCTARQTAMSRVLPIMSAIGPMIG
jgi:hypothetical protein